jgi:hypothetical protein
MESVLLTAVLSVGAAVGWGLLIAGAQAAGLGRSKRRRATR